MRRLTIAFVVTLGTFGLANAADKEGMMMGGGVGASGCPSFLNVMATARQRGGLHSINGVTEVVSFLNFVEGFRTGFNSESRGIFDIFAPLESGPDAGFAVLYAIEPWCQQHPEAKFGYAVLVLAETMAKNAR
jgi:hypothetical protein